MSALPGTWTAVLHDAGSAPCGGVAFFVTTPCLFGEPLPSSSVRLIDGALLPDGQAFPNTCGGCGAPLDADLTHLVARHATERLEDVT